MRKLLKFLRIPIFYVPPLDQSFVPFAAGIRSFIWKVPVGDGFPIETGLPGLEKNVII